MKLFKTMIMVLPAYLLLSACGSGRPDVKSVKPSTPAVATQSGDQASGAKTGTDSSTAPAAAPSIAEMEAQKAELEAQKADLEAMKAGVEQQQAAFAQNPAAAPAFGQFMAGAALPAGVDAAAVDDIIQAAMDLDIAGLIDAVMDLIADLVAAAADIQAQIDVLTAAIAAAKA